MSNTDELQPAPKPIDWEEHMRLQAAFLEVATLLQVQVVTGMDFRRVAELCAERARAGNPKADQAEAVLALIDGAVDALGYAIPSMPEPGKKDLQRAQNNIRRALPLLNELAGKSNSIRIIDGLRDCASRSADTLTRYAAECFPEITNGQKHFVRVLMESVADELRAALDGKESAP